MQQTKST